MTFQGSALLGIPGFATMLILMLLGACDNGANPGASADSESITAITEEDGSPSVPPGPLDDCPLTATQVGEVVGVPVQQDATICMFEPEPGNEPRVLYVRQVSFACSGAVVDDPSFDYVPYDGLGIQAYARPDGGDLLVCTNPPFAITVDITPDLDAIMADAEAASAAARASERTAAEQLARLILDR